MICVGIDVARTSDCFILSSEGEVWRMYLPFKTMQRALTHCKKLFAAASVQEIK